MTERLTFSLSKLISALYNKCIFNILCGLNSCNQQFSSLKTAAAKSLQSCLTLCDPIDGSPSGSPVPGILQARTLEWLAISFSNVWKWKAKGKSLSHVWLLATPWTATHQVPLSMGFSRQEYWSGVPLPSPSLKTHTHKCTDVIHSFLNFSFPSYLSFFPSFFFLSSASQKTKLIVII